MSTNGIGKSESQTAMHGTLLYQQQPVTQPAPYAAAPRSEVVLVSPAMAEYWLQSNTFNRKVRKSRVRLYARDMAAGRWLFNPQGIEFAVDGTLINGQHRLMAIVQSGVTVQMVVWFNVPPSTRQVIDIGGGRSLADTENLTTSQAAVTLSMMRGLNQSSNTASKAEQGAFYRRYATVIDDVTSRFSSYRKGIGQANVLGGIARAMLHMSPNDINLFCEILKSGMPTGSPRDITVIKLRDRLMSMKPSGVGNRAAVEIYALTVGALRAFREGRGISKVFATSVDPFPLPKDQAE